MPDLPTMPPEDAPGPHRLEVVQAYGFQLDEEAETAAVQQVIDQAQQVAQALASRVTNDTTRQVAETAVFTDGLKNKAAQSVAGAIAASQQAVQELQHPLYVDAVNQLGSIMEAAMPLGIVPVQPGETAACPTAVVIRASAAAGDLGPALQCYRSAALPLRDTRGMEYAKAVDFIQKALPPDPRLLSTFQSAISKIQAEPFPTAFAAGSSSASVAGHPQQFNILPAVGTATQQASSSSGPADMILPATLTVPPPTMPPQQVGLVGGDSSIPGFAEVPPTGPIPTGPAVSPGVNTANILPITGPGSANGSTPSSGGGATMPSCSEISGMSYDGVISAFGPPGTQHVTGSMFGIPFGWTYAFGGASADGTCMVFVTPFGQTGLPGFSCRIAGCPPFVPPVPPVVPIPEPPPNAVPPPPTTTPPPSYRPERPPLPPPKPEQPCIKICPTEPPKCDDPKYCLWQDGDTRVCYVLKEGEPPRRTFDKKLVCGTPSDSWLQQVCQACGMTPQPTPPGTGPAGPNVFGGPPACADFGPIPNAQLNNGLIDLGMWVGMLNADGTPVLPFPNAGPTDIGQNLVNTIIQLLAGPTKQILQAITQFISATGCADGQQIGMIAVSALTEFASRFVGSSVDQVAIPLRYNRNFRCPVGIPTADQASSAYLGNTIDAGTLECWVRANGFKFPEFAKVIDAGRRKLDPFQYAVLRRREIIDGATYGRKQRENGMLVGDDIDNLYRLTEQLPGPSDIVRLMVRDAADTINIDWSQEDALFPQKYKGQLAEWGRQQGVSDEFMQMFWRAHFGIPAPGQLAVMLHRLSRLPPGSPAFVDRATIRNALIQQDISPKWVEQFMAISYSPLTRIDARRAFEIGALSADGLKDAYLDLGYDDTAANTLVDFNRKNINRSFMRRPEVKELAAGKINQAEFTQSLQAFGATQEAIDAARSYADIRRSVNTRARCTASARTRFLKGEYGRDVAAGLLQSYGVDADVASQIVEGWVCELSAKGKLFSIAELNRLYEDGLITDLEYVQRAERLNWSQDDAVKQLRSLQRRLGIKIAKQQLAALKQEQAAQEKLARQLQQAAKEQQQSADRAKASGDRLRKLRELRTKRLIEAGEKFSRNSGTALPDAIVAINALYRAALSAYPVTNDEVIQALVVVAGDADITTLDLLSQALTTALTTTASLVDQTTPSA